MKKLLFFFVVFFMGLTLAFAQAPSTPLTYQSVVRNAQNQLVINQANITVTVSVWNAAGTSELYRESHSGLSTNDNGLLTLMLGSGTVNFGTWAGIDWSNASIKTVISYTTTEGTVSITSDPAPVTAVPYAIQAGNAIPQVQADWDETDDAQASFIQNKPNLATVATSGDYNDLSNKPTIPDAQVNADWNATSGVSEILNKPDLSVYATNAALNDFQTATNTTLTGMNTNISNLQSQITTNHDNIEAVQNSIGNGTLTIQTNGTPTGTFTANQATNQTINIDVRAAQAQANWDETNTESAAYIQNKPANVSAFTNDAGYLTEHQDISGKANTADLANVATSGSYNDLSNRPTIPTVPTNVSAFTNDAGYLTEHQDISGKANTADLATVATTGNYSDLNGTPTLATVATTGSYNNLIDQPAINDATLTIQKNSALVGTFTANQASDATINITVPTTVAELTDAADYATRPGANTFSGANDFTTGSITVPNAITTIDAAVANCTQDAVSVCDLVTVYNALVERIAVLEATVSSITENLTVPTVTTSAVTNLTASKATIGGVLVSAGAEGAPSVTERGVCYSTTNNPPTIADTKVADVSTTTGTFSHTLTGLQANTTYHVRAYANASDNNTYYGDVVTFTTLTPTLGVVPDQASPRVVCGEGDVIYTAEMEGDDIDNYTLAWYMDETVQDGQTSETFTVHSTATANYTVKCVATRTGGSAEGAITMDITVNPNPTITLTRFEGNAGEDWGKVEITDATNVASASWKLNDEELGTWTSGKTEVLPAGDYNVVLTSDQSCEVTENITVRTTPICVANYISEKETYYELAGKKYVKTIKDHENNEYNVLQIGSRCWTRENMRAVTSPTTGSYLIADKSNTASKSACWAGDSSTYAPQNYGVSYNWQAMTDVYNADYPEIANRPNGLAEGGTGDVQVPHITHPWRGICPEGWQLSQKTDYDALKSTFTTFGQLSTGTWYSSSGSTAGNQGYADRNISGFSALPAGMGGDSLSEAACFWTGTEYYEYDQNWRSCLYAYEYNGTNWYSFGAWNIWPFHHNRASVRCIRSNSAALILSRTPGSSQVGAGTSVAYTASITNDDPSGYTYTWTVDGTAQSETSNTFNYTFNESGNHTVACEATGNGNTFTQSLSTTVVVTPEVSTSATATGVGFNVATVGGNVTEVGYPAITKRGVCYNTTGTPTISDTKVEDAAATTGEYSTMLTGLADHTTYYVRAYATNSNGTVYGDEITFTTLQCGVDPLTDADGNTYNTVLIGSQCWMKENLRTSNVNSIGAVYTNNAEGYDVNIYGRLYDWAAVMQGESSTNYPASGTKVQGICPTGWHVPSDAEWTQLTDYVSSQSSYFCSGNASNIAKALASTTGWNSYTGDNSDRDCYPGYNSSGNDATGFSALPAGRYNSDSYYNFGQNAIFWSATENTSLNAYFRVLSNAFVTVTRGNINKDNGLSVRCVRD